MKNQNLKSNSKMKIQNIKISSSFETHPPRWEKVMKCYNHYVQTGDLGKPILISNGILVDNYVVYLVAKMFGVEEVEVEEI